MKSQGGVFDGRGEVEWLMTQMSSISSLRGGLVRQGDLRSLKDLNVYATVRQEKQHLSRSAQQAGTSINTLLTAGKCRENGRRRFSELHAWW
jgi:hypothetical protein